MRWIYMGFAFVCLWSCSTKPAPTRVDYHFIPFYFGKIYLERLPVNDEGYQVIDSAEVNFRTGHLSFQIPAMEESVFQLRIQGKPLRIHFINDAAHIVIRGSSTDPKNYSFENEGINRHLKAFIDEQKKITEKITAIEDTLQKNALQAHLLSQHDSLTRLFERQARAFADTTSSAGAFLFAYRMVNFGEDRQGLKHFISQTAKRFKGHKSIQALEAETMDYISIYEEELNVGDKMPSLSLKDSSDAEFTLSTTGQFTFIDLWSTWCAPCLNYIPAKKQAAEKIPAGKISFISIAIDAEKAAWKKILKEQRLPGIHVIDEKMWRGRAAKTWKFDSIPYNYLVSPEGKIIAKAIKADSLLQVLTKFVQ